VASPLSFLLATALGQELLTGENQYQCDACGGLRDARKTLTVVAVPAVLILVLLRFKYDAEAQCRRKLLSLVEYPERLEVEVAGRREVYRLDTVVVHSGAGSGAGHYYTWARQVQGFWVA
jgi:ubiquitin C-terminal hydrolase